MWAESEGWRDRRRQALHMGGRLGVWHLWVWHLWVWYLWAGQMEDNENCSTVYLVIYVVILFMRIMRVVVRAHK